MRKVLIELFERLPQKLKELLRFLFVLGYIPNINSPKTFNEKIQFRKRHYSNHLFKICSDKIKVKEYVKARISEEIVIENYLIADTISVDMLEIVSSEHGAAVVKANHNSGPVYPITGSESKVELTEICDDINTQLKNDYGKRKREPWYSEIYPRQILVERFLKPSSGEHLLDYKFHVFTRTGSNKPKIFLHIDFDRNSNHHRSFFDENLEWLPFHCKYPAIIREVEKPKNFERMLEIVGELAKPFSYVRVDLYNVDGEIFFGEMTFAHESGHGPFTSKAYDKWFGGHWQGDPSA